MKRVENRFGKGTLYGGYELGDNVYCACAACMSVYSDMLSYANRVERSRNITSYITDKTDTIVVLGCQVTDLAIYNDLRIAEDLHEKYPNIPIYMGGCLAQRFDIELPGWIRRLDVLRSEYEEIEDAEFHVDYKAPFWAKNFNEDEGEFKCGHIFRNMYPLKIGAGCHGKCKYCTIRDTRGESYETDAYLQIREFLKHADSREGVVLISDSPTVKQIKDWCHIAIRYDKPISFRNVEPQNANACRAELTALAEHGLLNIFHCPIQSNDKRVLEAMNRNVNETMEYIEFSHLLRENGVKVATNIIIDYVVNGEVIHNMDEEWLNKHFDYWSWNPYFDGKWDRQKAEERFVKYIG